ncbi:MAG TPA: hypothetical protein PKK94_19235 [Leptospiraceae bacterium]|nr:hypothetical protein [Leptospiraceae bacterium]
MSYSVKKNSRGFRFGWFLPKKTCCCTIIFIAEAGDLFKTFKAFLDKVLTELNDGISIIMNLEEKIQFNPKFEKATILQSKTIPDALRQFYEFIQAALDNIAMPGKLR